MTPRNQRETANKMKSERTCHPAQTHYSITDCRTPLGTVEVIDGVASSPLGCTLDHIGQGDVR